MVAFGTEKVRVNGQALSKFTFSKFTELGLGGQQAYKTWNIPVATAHMGSTLNALSLFSDILDSLFFYFEP